jgi:hypothetical protein
MAQVILVETVFNPPLTDEEHATVGKRLDACLQLREARWMRSYLQIDRQAMICEFEAPDTQSVRDAYRSAGVTFERAWAVELYKRP